MDHVLAVLACLGAWCLVAGPVYQAAVELQEGDAERERVQQLSARVPHPAPVSTWWWLVPPVRYVLERRRDRAYREAVLSVLGPTEISIMLDFINKASGWLLVGGGGFLLAVNETWLLVKEFQWPHWLFWLLSLLLAATSLIGVTMRIRRSQELLTEATRPVAG